MPNPQNIIKTQWKKGQCPNPKGRPKKCPELNELMALILSEEKDGKSAAEAILMSMRSKATKGDIKAAEFLFSYAYGKPTQKVEMESEVMNIRVIRE
jgi:hypothetical protein